MPLIAHVVVALDGVAVLLALAGRRARLDHVGVERALRSLNGRPDVHMVGRIVLGKLAR